MPTENQFIVFCLCMAIGFAGGVLYEPFSLLRSAFSVKDGKRKIIGGILDLLFCASFSMVCIVSAFMLDFPDFRVYMCIGYGVGGIIYLKTLHKVVAIFRKVCYNIAIKVCKSLKKTRKNSPKREEETI